VSASGLPAYGSYRPNPETGRLEPFSIQVVEVSGGRIIHVTHFLDTSLFPQFGLPLELPG
jgi:RNA polymerase sigma-70 factor (ECF subfamily)